MRKEQSRLPEKTWAYNWFFPAASIYAAVAIPLAIYAMTSGVMWPPGLVGAGHAYEMLFGFALAVVAGYTLGQMLRRDLLLLLAFWLAARLMTVAASDIATHVFNALFVITLAWHIVPRFLAAKKWRNRILSPLLLALCLSPIIYGIADYIAPTVERQHMLLLQGVLLVSLLMAFMGGRIIAPAAAGEAQRLGFELHARVQPRFEAALIVLLFIAAAALCFPQGHLMAGPGAAAAGVMAAIRLYRWRLWRFRQRPDLICLGAGYAWLALGLLLYGWSIYLDAHLIPALHVITVGALGTLSTGVMARVYFQHSRQAPPRRVVLGCAALIAVAVLCRGTADFNAGIQFGLLWTAAVAWFCAYLLLALYFFISQVFPEMLSGWPLRSSKS